MVVKFALAAAGTNGGGGTSGGGDTDGGDTGNDDSGGGDTGNGGGITDDWVGDAVNSAVGLYRSVIGGLIRSGTSFVINYAIPVYEDAVRAASKAYFDGLSSVQKSLTIGKFADAADTFGKLGPTTGQILRSALTKMNVLLTPLAIYDAYQAMNQAAQLTPREQTHAVIETWAAALPVAGAAVGSVVPVVGTALGFAIGSALSTGLIIGNEITKAFGL